MSAPAQLTCHSRTVAFGFLEIIPFAIGSVAAYNWVEYTNEQRKQEHNLALLKFRHEEQIYKDTRKQK